MSAVRGLALVAGTVSGPGGWELGCHQGEVWERGLFSSFDFFLGLLLSEGARESGGGCVFHWDLNVWFYSVAK